MTVKRKIVISITIVLTIMVLIVYFVILPTVRDIKKISTAIYQERVDLEKKYLQGQLLRKTIENFEKIKPEEDKLINAFLPAGEELKFITAIEQIAALHSLEQKLQLQPNQNKREGQGFSSLPLDISISGKFTPVLQYLKDLQRLNYYFNIYSLTLTAGNQPGINPEVTAVLNGKIYTLPAEKK